MAIVKMKRVTFVGPADLKETTLAILQKLGVIHVLPLVEEVVDPAEISGKLLAIHRVKSAIQKRAREIKSKPTPPSIPDHEVLSRAEAALNRIGELESRLLVLKKEHEQQAPWGDLERSDIDELQAAGLFVRIYAVRSDQLEDLDLKRTVWHGLMPYPAKARHQALAVITLDEPMSLDLEQVPAPSRSAPEIDEELERARKEIAEAMEELDLFVGALPAVGREADRVTDKLNLARAMGSASSDEDVFACVGFCPEEKVEEVKKALPSHTAVLVSEPRRNENIPVEIRNGPIIKFFEPMLKMFNLPHYRELDPTVLFAPFMAIFFGFCLGDAAYGVLLLGAATYMRKKIDLEGDGLKAVQMLQLLGISTIVIGLLTGVVFGVQLFTISYVRDLGLDQGKLLFFLTADPIKFFYASLLFGVVQLSLGLILKLIRNIQMEQYQLSISTVAWLLVLPSFIGWYHYKITWCLYVLAGTGALILVFSCPYEGIGKRIGLGFWNLYGITGLFGDMVSYCRVFGLGLSSGIIGLVVNQMAMRVGSVKPPFTWLAAVLILVAGHGFNFVMSTIGAMVHPARLQFLEFFKQFFEGGGTAYSPLRKLGTDKAVQKEQ